MRRKSAWDAASSTPGTAATTLTAIAEATDDEVSRGGAKCAGPDGHRELGTRDGAAHQR
jgi:hypothetical protein